jgi:uncharacterized phosphatase
VDQQTNKMKHLYFVRHGESIRNLQRIFAGQYDTPLTDRGRDQARQAGERARHLAVNLIVSSPLSRALETAQIIASSIGYPLDTILVQEVFKERSLGTLEGKSWDEYDEAATEDNGAETDAELLNRATKGLVILQERPEDSILLVGHGSFSRALRKALDPAGTYDEPENAEIVQLV